MSLPDCGCGSVLCYGCRSAKAVLLIAGDLERLYPGNTHMQKRAAQLRQIVNEWLAESIEVSVQIITTEMQKRARL